MRTRTTACCDRGADRDLVAEVHGRKSTAAIMAMCEFPFSVLD
jgi:hypothetical protein